MDENGYIEAQWPSKRIAPGGLFHQHKVEYSSETQKTLKVLMDEANLTLMQRKQMDWCLRSGKSLVDLSKEDGREKQPVKPSFVRPRTSRRRSYSVIKNSGDLDREIFKPTVRIEDREMVKKHLQHIMEFGREDDAPQNRIKLKMTKSAPSNKLPSKMDMLHDLLTQIQEREEWLREMESLGEGVKHREVIADQIAERVRRIEALNITNRDEEDSTRKTKNNCGEGDEKLKIPSDTPLINEKGKTSSLNNDTLNKFELETISINSSESKEFNPKRIISNKPRISTTNSNESKNSASKSDAFKCSASRLKKSPYCNLTNDCVDPIDEEKKKEELRQREEKIEILKKKIEKMNRDEGLDEEKSIMGFSLEGSPYVAAERTVKPKSVASGRISKEDSVKNMKKK